MHPDTPPLERLEWLAVDFDGTLAVSRWTLDDPYKLGEPIPVNVDKLRLMRARGWRIAIHTARPWSQWQAIKNWCEFYHVEVDQIVCGKLLAAYYIDDRAIPADFVDWSMGRDPKS